MNTTILKTTAAPSWAASACTRPFGIAPISPLQGTAVSFAGYGATGTAVEMKLAAVRHDDARVPDPRERKR